MSLPRTRCGGTAGSPDRVSILEEETCDLEYDIYITQFNS